MKYSPSKNTFWHDDIKYAEKSSDLIDISDELHHHLIEGVNNLKVIIPNGNVDPALAELPDATQDQIILSAEKRRLFFTCDIENISN